MTISKDKVTITVVIDADVKKDLVKYAKDLDSTLSKVIKAFLYVGLHDFTLVKKTGILAIGKTLVNIVDSLPKTKTTPKAKTSSQEEIPVDVSIVIDKNVKILLEEHSKYLDIPVKKFARNLIYSALEDYHFLKKTGLLRIAYTFRKYVESFEEFEKKH